MSETRIKLSKRTGFLGLWLFCFSAFLSTAAVVAGYVIFTIAMLFADINWRQWVREPLVLASTGFCIFKGLWFLLLVSLLLILAQGFIQSYSRGAWLAMLITLLVMGVVWYWGRDRERSQLSTRSLATVTILLLAGTLIVVMLNLEKIQQRMALESDVFSQIMDNERDATKISSTGLRLNVWAYGLDKFTERPLFGWGPGTTGYLVEQSGLPDQLRNAGGEWLPHLHNTYVDVLVQFGLVGLLWTLVLLVLLGRMVIKASRAGEMPRHYTLFFIAVLVFASVWAIFDYRVVHRDWRFSWILLAGTIFSFHLQTLFEKTAGILGRGVSE